MNTTQTIFIVIAIIVVIFWVVGVLGWSIFQKVMQVVDPEKYPSKVKEAEPAAVVTQTKQSAPESTGPKVLKAVPRYGHAIILLDNGEELPMTFEYRWYADAFISYINMNAPMSKKEMNQWYQKALKAKW
jgi:regulatory protein YycI of two-component signal transduction system YycFG